MMLSLIVDNNNILHRNEWRIKMEDWYLPVHCMLNSYEDRSVSGQFLKSGWVFCVTI